MNRINGRNIQADYSDPHPVDDQGVEDHANRLLIANPGRVIARTRFLGLIGQDGQDGQDATDDAELLELLGREYDPWDFETKEKLIDLRFVAQEMAEVHLLIVALEGLEILESNATGRKGLTWRFRIHTSGLRPWLGRRFFVNLLLWAEREASAASRSLKLVLARFVQRAAESTSTGIRAMVLACLRAILAGRGPVDRVADTLLPRILAPGGQTALFIPQT